MILVHEAVVPTTLCMVLFKRLYGFCVKTSYLLYSFHFNSLKNKTLRAYSNI